MILEHLKVVCNENQGRTVGKMADAGHWCRTVAIDVLLSSNFDVVMYLMYFRFCQVKHN
jgi:hypothetical protein